MILFFNYSDVMDFYNDSGQKFFEIMDKETQLNKDLLHIARRLRHVARHGTALTFESISKEYFDKVRKINELTMKKNQMFVESLLHDAWKEGFTRPK